MARDKFHNNIMVLKEADIKLTSDQRKLLKELKPNEPDLKIKVKEMNLNTQVYKGIPLRLINRKDYHSKDAKRYVINETNQNIWIPNCYLTENGTIKPGVDLSFMLNTRHFYNKLNKAYKINFEA